MTFNHKSIRPEKVTHGTINVPGVNFLERKILTVDQIYQPPIANNPTRSKGKDSSQVLSLQHSLSLGIDYSRMPPIVKRIIPRMDVLGNMLYYELVTGHHRMEALRTLGYDSWVFDVYDNITAEDVKITVQFKENDHTPQLSVTENDAVKTILTLIGMKSNFIPADEDGSYEDSIWTYINTYSSHMHHNTKCKVLKDCIRHLQDNNMMPYYDYYEYTKEDVVRYIDQHTDLTMRGRYDTKRDQYGWCFQQGYESEFIMNAMKKFYDTGKLSYFSLHTKTPTEDNTLEDRRQNMVENIHEFGSMIIECANFYKKHGKMPWSIMGYLPQDRPNEGQNYIFND